MFLPPFFFKIFIGGVVVFVIIGGLIFIRDQRFKKELNPFAIVKDTFQNLINQYSPQQPEMVEIPLSKEVAKEENKETESSGEKEEIEKIELTLESILADITEEIDDVSERIDILSQEINNFLKERAKMEEISEEIEEKEEETEELKEEKVEQKEIVLCQRGDGNPIRNKVIFNEIAWMGSYNSPNDEWIELRNISGAEMDLTDWQIINKDKKIKIIFDGDFEGERFSVNSFLLLERTKDDSVPGIIADLIYTGALKNEDEILYLFDENCKLQDGVSANLDWSAGDNTSKRTMERKGDLSWQTSLNPGGTPKVENSSGYFIMSTVSSSGVPPPPSYPKILISEIQILPIEERFIELYNPNDNEANLTGWYIQRKTKTGTSWASLVSSTQFEGKIISPRGYFLITRSSIGNSDIILEDLTLTEDNVTLLKNPNREIVDKLGWGESQDFETAPIKNPPSSQSIGRKWDEEKQEYQDTDNNQTDFEIQDPTPKTENQSLVPPATPQDTTPPQVIFSPISTLQTQLSFTISWSGEDLAEGTTTPSGIDGFQLRYSEDKENWDYFPSESEYTQENQYLFIGEDEKTYYFQIKAKDVVGNESDWVEISTEINTLPIVINEIAWMGTTVDWRNEWIELYNNTNSSIDLNGWTLQAADDTPKIQLARTILAKNFYLLERTDDETLPNISAEQIYTGTLGNNGENLELFDNFGNLIDSVNCTSGWFAGNNETKQTMERKNPRNSGNDSLNWLDSQGADGTPKSQNSQYTP